MFFSDFSGYLLRLESEDGRLKMTETLAELFNNLSIDEIDKACYLVLGVLAPKYQGFEFNMAEKMTIRSIAASLHISEQDVSAGVKEAGDLGDFIFQKKRETSSTLELLKVYEALFNIAQLEGLGSAEKKVSRSADLLLKLDRLSAKYIARILVGKLRLGFSSMTILDALSWSKVKNKSLRPPLENAFNLRSDIGQIAKIFKKTGIKELLKIQPSPGIPLRAAKAEAMKDSGEILKKMSGQCLIEPKYDGLRTMLHLNKNVKESDIDKNLELFVVKDEKKYLARIFSRNMENMTDMFPDIVTALKKLPVESVILDGEAIALDTTTGEYLAFQETIQRKRKHNVVKMSKKIPLNVFVFDILFLNGKSLIACPFSERRAVLEKLLGTGNEEIIRLTEQKRVSSADEFDKFFRQMKSGGLEGLMAKKANSSYRSGMRDHNWIKYKVGMQSDLADTLDCVVMGYYKGKGKRNKFGIGAFLVGIIKKQAKLKNEDGHSFVSVSKIGTGLSDEQWEELYKRCQKIRTPKKPENYLLDNSLYPDIWCKPALVVEIEADTVTKSPIHSAGLALRFPRLKRFRDDKRVEESTSLLRLKKMYGNS